MAKVVFKVYLQPCAVSLVYSSWFSACTRLVECLFRVGIRFTLGLFGVGFGFIDGFGFT